MTSKTAIGSIAFLALACVCASTARAQESESETWYYATAGLKSVVTGDFKGMSGQIGVIHRRGLSLNWQTNFTLFSKPGTITEDFDQSLFEPWTDRTSVATSVDWLRLGSRCTRGGIRVEGSGTFTRWSDGDTEPDATVLSIAAGPTTRICLAPTGDKAVSEAWITLAVLRGVRAIRGELDQPRLDRFREDLIQTAKTTHGTYEFLAMLTLRFGNYLIVQPYGRYVVMPDIDIDGEDGIVVGLRGGVELSKLWGSEGNE